MPSFSSAGDGEAGGGVEAVLFRARPLEEYSEVLNQHVGRAAQICPMSLDYANCVSGWLYVQTIFIVLCTTQLLLANGHVKHLSLFNVKYTTLKAHLIYILL